MRNSSCPRLYTDRPVVAKSSIRIVRSPKVDIVFQGTIRLSLTLWTYLILCYQSRPGPDKACLFGFIIFSGAVDSTSLPDLTD